MTDIIKYLGKKQGRSGHAHYDSAWKAWTLESLRAWNERDASLHLASNLQEMTVFGVFVSSRFLSDYYAQSHPNSKKMPYYHCSHCLFNTFNYLSEMIDEGEGVAWPYAYDDRHAFFRLITDGTMDEAWEAATPLGFREIIDACYKSADTPVDFERPLVEQILSQLYSTPNFLDNFQRYAMVKQDVVSIDLADETHFRMIIEIDASSQESLLGTTPEEILKNILERRQRAKSNS